MKGTDILINGGYGTVGRRVATDFAPDYRAASSWRAGELEEDERLRERIVELTPGLMSPAPAPPTDPMLVQFSSLREPRLPRPRRPRGGPYATMIMFMRHHDIW